ncbi:methyltransferase-like protein 25 [Protopterus annectens]|uniref:methyltransferase-like protein 25 n=1 Tax=Protopterus annectens TaxID=7888 RepID=UPI001CF9640A|nr:methyltransferase-like protein 25 [Protopterus annectens]
MVSLQCEDIGLETVQSKIDTLRSFVTAWMKICNANTVDLYTKDIWNQFIAVTPEAVLAALKIVGSENTSASVEVPYVVCDNSNRLVDIASYIRATKAHSLPYIGACTPLEQLLEEKNRKRQETIDETVKINECMNSKKAHEVEVMSELITSLARHCGIQQVIDLGSGKGYLSSFLSMQYGLKVYGIDSSSINTQGANERNRKLKKYWRAYQVRRTSADVRGQRSEGSVKEMPDSLELREDTNCDAVSKNSADHLEDHVAVSRSSELDSTVGFIEFDSADVSGASPCISADHRLTESENSLLQVLSVNAVELNTVLVQKKQLSEEEREQKKRLNLQKKMANRSDETSTYSPLTSYVTAETELQEIISDMEDSIMVGLHTCGDLAANTLRIFVAKSELKAVCSVGCCYHLLTEEFDNQEGCSFGPWGFPMSQYLKNQAWCFGRNARMSACLALERVAVGQGLCVESLFYRAILQMIMENDFGVTKSSKRVGNAFAKSSSFVDYIRRALRKLELDDSKLPDRKIQDYYEKYRPRLNEMEAFNMLKVALSPCIEGLILLDRLCYLKEQDNVSWSGLVRLFDPLKSPRCYAIVAMKTQ